MSLLQKPYSVAVRSEFRRAGIARISLAAAILGVSLAGASAQTGKPGALSLELNDAQASEKGCRLTFVVHNGLGSDLSKAGFEVVLFNKAGVVDRITALEFKDLVAAKTKVSRFDLSGVQCDTIGRVLVNSVTSCEGAGVKAELCAKQLKTNSKAAGLDFGT